MKLSEIERILKNCHICYNGAVFTEEVLIQKFSHFIANSISFEHDRKKKRNKKKRAVILHTGSDCFDALLLVCMCFMCILDNPYDLETYIGEIRNGEMVWFGDTKPSPYRFLKRKGDTIYLEQQNSGSTTKRTIPRNNWYKIRKYNGNSQTVNTRGSRFRNEKQADNMMLSVFGKHFTPILLSAGIHCPRLRAEELT